MSLCLFCSFLFVCVLLSLSLHPHHWEEERRKHVLQELVHLQWKACCIVHPLSMSPFWLSTTKTLVLLESLPSPLSQLASHRVLSAMAKEMADLASALNKMEVSKKTEEEKPSPPSEQPEQQKKSEESPPASSDKPAEKESPPSQEEKPSSQAEREEVTHRLGSSKAAEETALTSPPEPEKKKDPADDDILEFTSATEGEASSSAWELVPEKKIARKKGVNSDSELDHMVKKAVREEAEQRKLTSQAQLTSAAVTTSSGASSTTVKDVVTSIPEDTAAEAAEEEGNKAEAEAAEKAITAAWEAEFSLEDAPTPPSKDILTTGIAGPQELDGGSSHP